MENVEFIIPGKPIPWTAPRVTRYRTFSTHSTSAKKIRDFVKNTYKGELFIGAINCSLEFYVPIPKSTSKKIRLLMLEGKIRPTTRPDRTNLCKLTEDVFNGIIYLDDSQIVGGSVEKWYSDNPRIVVKIETIDVN